MPARITIACEHCGAKLALADDSKLGKKIKCPKCSEVFVAATDDDDIEDVLEEDDDDDEEIQPRRKPAAAAAAGKGAKGKAGGKGKKKSGGNLGLIIGGAVAVGVLVIGGLIGVLFVTGVIGGGPKSDPNQIVMTPITPSPPAGNSAPKATPPATENSNPAPATTPAASANSVAANNSTPTKAADSAPTSTASAIPARSAIPETAKWLPANAEIVVHVRVADILASPLVSELLKANQLDGQLDAVASQFGLQVSDVESFTSGVSKLEEVARQTQQMQLALMTGQSPAPATWQPSSLGVVKLKKPLTYDVVQQFPSPIPFVKQQHAGKDYLEMADPVTGIKSGVWLASETEVVFGDDASVKAAMEKGGSSSTLPNFGFVDWTRQLTIAVAPKDLATVRSLKPPQSTNPLFDQMIDAFVNGVTGASIGLTVKGGIDLEVAVGCVDEPKMEAIVKALNDAVGLAKLQYDQSKKAIPPWAASLTDQLVANVQVAGSNRVAIFSTNLPDSNQQQLVNLPAMIMGQMKLSAATSRSQGNPPAGADVSPGETRSESASGVSLDPYEVETIPEGAPENITLFGTLMDAPETPAPERARTKKATKNERIITMGVAAIWTGEKENCLLAAAGKLKPKGGQSSDGKKIKVSLIPFPVDDPKSMEMMPVAFLKEYEPAVVMGQFKLTVAEGETEPLKSVSGVCTLVTGKPVKLVTVANINDQIGKEPEDADLKQAGFEVKTATVKGDEAFIVTVKDGYLLSRLKAVDGEGNPLAGTICNNEKNERSQRLVIKDAALNDRPDLGFQAYLYTDLEEVSVPFTFENVGLPVKPAAEPKQK
jgi:hypothetical protein